MKFSIDDVDIILQIICEFHDNWCHESYTLLQGINDVLPILSTFLSNLDNIQYRCPQQFIGAFQGCENQYSDIHASHRDGKLISVCTLHICIQIWVKFGVKGLHIMLLSKKWV
jgi:hypothetical protein